MPMLTRARFTPSREPLTTLSHRLLDDDLFSAAAKSFFGSALANEAAPAQGWNPRVDIQETESAFRLHADLPGLGREDIDVTFEDNVLTLSGERSFLNEDEKDTFRRVERAYGSFARAFNLPSEVDAERIEATFKNGVLMVEIPKAEKILPKKIQVS